MTENERNVVKLLIRITHDNQNNKLIKSIKDKFIKDFTVNVKKNPNYLISLLEIAYKEKNALDVYYSLCIGFHFDLFTKDFVNIFIKLIESDWHNEHEDIASIMQYLKSPKTVNCLYNTALKQFKYLDYDEFYALAVKCIWALGAIKTDEAREKLKLLSKSKNIIIKENAIKQLSM